MEVYQYARALTECNIMNSELTVPYPGIDMKELGDTLRGAIQRGEVPHTKVIAVKVGWGANTQGDLTVIKKTAVASRSYAELQGILQDVIFETGGGKAPGDFKWRFKSVRDFNIKEILEKQTGYAVSVSNHVTTGNDKSIIYTQEADRGVTFLIDDVSVIDFTRDDAKISFVLKEGTGVVDFNNEIVKNISESSRYFPVMQYYNLTPFLSVRRCKSGAEKSVKFMYKRHINEKVLQNIIRNYGESLMRKERSDNLWH